MSTQFPQSIETQSVKDYLISIINPLNVLNTETGLTALTINEANGIAVFTQSIADGDSQDFTITNSGITTSSYLECLLTYPSGGSGQPILTSYSAQNEEVIVTVFNSGTEPTDENITITFRIIG